MIALSLNNEDSPPPPPPKHLFCLRQVGSATKHILLEKLLIILIIFPKINNIVIEYHL